MDLSNPEEPLPFPVAAAAPPPFPPAPAIAVRDLRKYYDTRAAVDGLTLTVPRGCFFGFLGPNGAGKTTTIKMLMGVSTPNSGDIEILGLRMPEQGTEIKRQIGLVPEDTLLFDHLTGQEYMEFTGRIYGLPAAMTHERTRELLGLFQMDGQGRKLIGEYSKGMRKRVAMAAALLHRPQLFLMDEPFEGVDAVGARLMKDILLDLVSKGATIFLTSHVLEVVERLCDRVAIISDGKLVVDDSMDNLRGGPESLEEMFVRVVGGARASENLEWL
ncbi:MAG: ABC transporter ATP-binding protein [Acidobacteria bacterium]|nr:ABC transporter ATP-binding protein [Acidobacteriota bacterium]